MNFIIDKSIVELGIKSVVIGIAKNIDPQAPLSDSFLTKQKKMQDWALQCDVDEILKHPVTQGYADLLQSVGRSIKKYPPTVPAFIRNIQRRGSMPHINSVIDIYNVESLHSLLAIGGHDLDKIDGQIEFTVNKEAGVFLPISSTEKHVAETDYVYRDPKGIIAWLGVRDGEQYKFDDRTKNAIFIIQGNANTSVEMRVEALKRIQNDLAECMPQLVFEIQTVEA
ncbi:B3/B4 domain-containing protein [Treponema vincentii]|uniref:B3/B4 domain-containing protein n=1 Tax=Treponema vincentii TaxID=69710 RepID=UPI003D8B901D